MDSYVGLSFRISTALADELPELLDGWPVLGTVIEESGGMAVVTAYMQGRDKVNAMAFAEALGKIGALDLSIEEMGGEDWLAGYREQAVAFPVGDGWWVDPRPDSCSPCPRGRTRLVIEPREAFGSGSHESTQLVLGTLEEMDLRGLRVLDLGTGSGILSYAADSRGAGQVVALDIDSQAVWAAHQICGQQEWAPAVDFVLGPVGCLVAQAFDLILCNMISGNFLPLAGDIRKTLARDGKVVFSGFLTGEERAVAAALVGHGLSVEKTFRIDEWACLVAGDVE